jgi:DegT/DnrJ/EryC1/StrS aminotransferase family
MLPGCGSVSQACGARFTTGEGGMVRDRRPGPGRGPAEHAQPGPRRGRHLAPSRAARLQLPARRTVGGDRGCPGRAPRRAASWPRPGCVHLRARARRSRLGPPAAGRGRRDGRLVRVRRPARSLDRPGRAHPASRGARRSGSALPPALHLQPLYQKRFDFRPRDFPVTERVAASTLALPFSSRLSDEDVEYAANALIELATA